MRERCAGGGVDGSRAAGTARLCRTRPGRAADMHGVAPAASGAPGVRGRCGRHRKQLRFSGVQSFCESRTWCMHIRRAASYGAVPTPAAGAADAAVSVALVRLSRALQGMAVVLLSVMG